MVGGFVLFQVGLGHGATQHGEHSVDAENRATHYGKQAERAGVFNQARGVRGQLINGCWFSCGGGWGDDG